MNRAPVYKKSMPPMPEPSPTVKATEPIFLIDLDGTLADFDGAMTAGLATLMSPNEKLPTEDAAWSEAEPWVKARRDLIKRQPGFWRNLAPIPEGFAVLEMAKRLKLQPMVLTKGPFHTTGAWTEKVDWCRAHIPDVPVTISEDKGLVYGRVLFDDWPSYALRWLEWRPRGLVVMLEHPWNREFHHPNVFRYRRGLDGDAWKAQEAELEKRLVHARDR